MIYVPKSNDLILFTQTTSAILSEYGIDKRFNWSQSVVNIEPNQSALVIDSYTINNNQANLSFNNASHTTHKIPPHRYKPTSLQPPTILVVSLSNLIVEVLFDPDLIDTTPHPTNQRPKPPPSVYLIMAR